MARKKSLHHILSGNQPALSPALHQDNADAFDQPALDAVVDPIARVIAVSVAIAIGTWALAIFGFKQARFALYAPEAAASVEAAAALARLFGAVVLSLFPADQFGQRLRWVAAGFGILGLGGLIFGFLRLLVFDAPDFNTSIYAALMVRTIAGVLFVVGLLPRTPPRFNRLSLAASLTTFFALGLMIVRVAPPLPPLVQSANLQDAVAAGDAALPGLTSWHWGLSLVPMGLALAAVWGAARHGGAGTLGRWLLVAMVLQAGAQLHNLFWPSIYSPVVTTADLMRLLFAAVVAIGGIVELRRIAREYAALLAVAREHTRRLNELARMKADFSAMVAHELASPIAAIRGLATILATTRLDNESQRQIVAAIQTETASLDALAADVGTAAQVEREEFSVDPRPVPAAFLLHDAAMFARTLPGQHPIEVDESVSIPVLADRKRIGQVLRNLLSNAAKYSPDGTPIEVRAIVNGTHVRIEVSDHGYGIHPDDLARIFEKYGRGRDETNQRLPGVGLGLYLSQRIVRAHGSELSVQSVLGEGSVFLFQLEIAHDPLADRR